MRQSTHLLPTLPACLVAFLALLCLGPDFAQAQARYRVARTENFRREPSPQGSLLAVVNGAVELGSDTSAGRWVGLILEGWVWARSLDSTDREGFDLIVTGRDGENVRAEPNGRILARLSSGVLLQEADRRPGWVKVRRNGWMFEQSVERLGGGQGGAPASRPAAAPASAPGADTAVGPLLDRAVTAANATLYRTPDGEAGGTLAAESAVRVLARSGEWVRVQTEGWLREGDLRPSAPGVLVGVSGAEVRTYPQRFQGQLVQWVVQYIALQTADETRRDIPEGQRYMLARGPLPEAGFVYVLLSEAQLREIERLPLLSELTIVGRVRTGRSQYLGNPVLTLVEVALRRQQ